MKINWLFQGCWPGLSPTTKQPTIMCLFSRLGGISSTNACQTTACISPTHQQRCTTWAKGYFIYHIFRTLFKIKLNNPVSLPLWNQVTMMYNCDQHLGMHKSHYKWHQICDYLLILCTLTVMFPGFPITDWHRFLLQTLPTPGHNSRGRVTWPSGEVAVCSPGR